MGLYRISRIGAKLEASDLTIKPKVITVHGVCPGPWQETARRVLTPHFDYYAVDYPQYNCSRGGALKAVAHPLIVVFAFGAAARVFFSDAPAPWAAASLGLLILSGVIAHVQRRACASEIKTRLSEETVNAYSTCVIAHSFGTYLVGRAMKTYDIQFDRVIFVGCVLPRRFDWQRVMSARPPVDPEFARLVSGPEIRNEIGMADMVSWFAGATGWLSRELGRAGQKGFVAAADLVHTASGPWDHPSLKAPVQNIPLKDYFHSTWALGPGHMLELWLPYLWGYPPKPFRVWRVVCSRATQQLQAKNREGYTDAVALLLRKEWPWTSRPNGTARTLELCLREKIGGDAPYQQRVIREVMSLLVHGVQLAQSAAVSSPETASVQDERSVVEQTSAADEKIRTRLNPQLAIDYAIADVLTAGA